MSGYGGTQMPSGLKGAYFSNLAFQGQPIMRDDPNVNFDFISQDPVDGVNNAQFSVRWTGFLKVPKSGEYYFRVESSGGARLFVNKYRVYSENMPKASSPSTGAIKIDTTNYGHEPADASHLYLKADTYVPFILEAYHSVHLGYNRDDSFFRVYWSRDDMAEEIISPEYFFTNV
eukprot:GHVR01173694.1.p1 GENE.GHVR01173694.1~~GHVR01173694.1.p1  ORF type:complete len:174 (+),score=5.07 GHVR01173694.1:609-1130(+)